MQYKAYKDECYVIGMCVEDKDELPLKQVEFFDGYVDLSPEERNVFEIVEREYFKWQEELSKRYKRK